MPSDQNRAFHYALLASLVVHGVMLFGLQQRNSPRTLAPSLPIEARLVEPPPVPAQPPVLTPPAEPVKPKQTAKPRAKPRPEPRPAEAPVLSTPTPAPAVEPAPAVSAAEPAPPAVNTEQATSPPPPPPPAPVASDVLDPGVIAQYRVQLLGAAPRYKVYPAAARDNSWEGLVVLRMVVAPSGAVASLTVQKSSGYRILDQQALEMFRKASSAVPVPPALRGREFAVEQLAVNYYFEVKN